MKKLTAFFCCLFMSFSSTGFSQPKVLMPIDMSEEEGADASVYPTFAEPAMVPPEPMPEPLEGVQVRKVQPSSRLQAQPAPEERRVSTPSKPSKTTEPTAARKPAAPVRMEPDLEEEQAPVVSRRAPVSTAQPRRTLSKASEPDDNATKISIRLRELQILQQAATMAGGSLRISIEPVGITVEDLIVPLKTLGFFDLEFLPNENRVVVQSKSKDPEVAEMEKKVADLKIARRRLLRDIMALERMKSNPGNSGMDSADAKVPAAGRESMMAEETSVVTLQPRLQ